MKKTLLLMIIPAFFISLAIFSQINTASADDALNIQNQQGFQSGGPIQSAFGAQDKPADPRQIIANIIQIVLGFLATIFVVLLIYAGFKYMTAAGNEDAVSDAKKLIIQAVIGLLIILSAWAITVFIAKSLLKAVSNTTSITPF